MGLLHTVFGYLWEIFWGWQGLAFFVLGVNELSGWLFGRQFKLLHQHRIPIALLLLFVAQGVAYHDLAKKQTPARQHGAAERIIERVDPNVELQGRLNDLQSASAIKDVELQTLRDENASLARDLSVLRDSLRDKRDVQSALTKLATYKERWDMFHKKTATICRRDQVGNTEQEYAEVSRETREALVALGYNEYVDDFVDMSNCPQSGVPTVCLSGGGFNPEATKWFSSAACRIRNLRAIIDRLREVNAGIK